MIKRSLSFLFRSMKRGTDARRTGAAVSALRRAFNLQVLQEVSIRSNDVVIRVADGRAFVWDPTHPNCLLTLPSEGDFERRESDFVRSWLRPGDVVFDVGANFGWYTTLFRQCLSGRGSVHAFEPTPDAFAALKRHLALNLSETTITVNQVAVGESPGRFAMWIPRRAGRGTAFASLRQQDRIGRQDKIEVDVLTLSDYVEDNGIDRIDLIKCDVEGAEMLVLRGSLSIMDRGFRPVWLVEVSDRHMHKFGDTVRDFVQVMLDRGYIPCDIEVDGLLREVATRNFSHFNNLVFVPREIVRAENAGPRGVLCRR